MGKDGEDVQDTWLDFIEDKCNKRMACHWRNLSVQLKIDASAGLCQGCQRARLCRHGTEEEEEEAEYRFDLSERYFVLDLTGPSTCQPASNRCDSGNTR